VEKGEHSAMPVAGRCGVVASLRFVYSLRSDINQLRTYITAVDHNQILFNSPEKHVSA